MAQKSFVWSHVTKDGEYFVCNSCNTKIKSGGGSTSSIKRHLKIQHSIDENSGQVENSGVSTMNAASPKKSYNAIPAEEINKEAVKMIAINQMPISFISSDGFKSFCKLFPGYVPIKEEAAKRRLCAIYEEVGVKVRQLLNNSKYIAFTTDLWTSMANDAYLTIIAHCIDEEWKPQVYTLDTVVMPERHTGINIAQKVNEIKNKWIETSQISGIVTDNARNMLCAVRNVDDVEIRDEITCTAHSLQLIINKSIENEEISLLLAKASKVVGHFKKSCLATEALKNKQEQLGLPQQKLLQQNNTRWNSTFYMLERLIRNRGAIANVLADRMITNAAIAQQLEINEQDWHKIEILVEILQPAEILTKLLCSDKSSLSMVRPLIYQWKMKYLVENQGEEQTFGSAIKNKIKELINLKFPTSPDPCTKMISSFLDPRYKDLDHENNNEKAKIEVVVKDMINDMSVDTNLSFLSATTTQNKSLFQQFYKEVGYNSNDGDSQWIRYMAETQIGFDMDPYEWWKGKQSKFPLIAKLAKKYMCIPPTSASSERCFSTAGNIVTVKRSSLLPTNVNILIFLHQNKQLMD